jgi:hypothetical protein
LADGVEHNDLGAGHFDAVQPSSKQIASLLNSPNLAFAQNFNRWRRLRDGLRNDRRRLPRLPGRVAAGLVSL